MFMSVLKKNLKSFVAATIGLLHFILMALPFRAVKLKVVSATKTAVSGYKCLTTGAISGGGFQIFCEVLALLAAIGLLALGGYLVVRAFIKSDKLPAGFGKLSFSKLMNFVHLGYAGACFLVFVSCIIVSLANSSSAEAFGATVSLKIGLGIGVILMFLLGTGSVVALFLLEKKGVFAGEKEEPRKASVKITYACSQCGTPAAAGAAFCGACGGKIKAFLPVEYACSQCGDPSDGTVAFCSKCGGQIVAKPTPDHFCSNCGVAADADSAFCGDCGGAIIHN